MMVIFQKNPEPNFRGPVGTLPVKILNISSHRQIHLLLLYETLEKRDGKKKKMCAPHTLPHS
tara:strand:- start:109 stop:294 length:186 start_codon:yes stop_codon:yes gene_type:complete